MLFHVPFEIPIVTSFLGNWFNVLPFVVVALMLVQTKLFSPPATTPEAERQQKMMKYMMIFMGVMFYKVPSGLGLYFITSSTWAICERLLLPKMTHAQLAGGTGKSDQDGATRRVPAARWRRQGRTRRQWRVRPSPPAGSPSSGIASSTRPARTRLTARSPRKSRRKTKERRDPEPAQTQAEETLTRAGLPLRRENDARRARPQRYDRGRGQPARAGASRDRPALRARGVVDRAPELHSLTGSRTFHSDARSSARARCESTGLRPLLPVMLALWPAPRTYTGQNVAEIHLPGSTPLGELGAGPLPGRGARLAEPGEFTLRAFLSGRIDLTRAEAVLGVIDARNQAQLEAALEQLAGGLSGPILALRDRLLDVLAQLEANLDFTEEPDVDPLGRAALADELAGSAAELRSLAQRLSDRDRPEGYPRVVLVGPPNVGKSRLFNALLERDQAIVSPQAGTTRDYLTALCRLRWADRRAGRYRRDRSARRYHCRPGAGPACPGGRPSRPPARLPIDRAER